MLKLYYYSFKKNLKIILLFTLSICPWKNGIKGENRPSHLSSWVYSVDPCPEFIPHLTTTKMFFSTTCSQETFTGLIILTSCTEISIEFLGILKTKIMYKKKRKRTLTSYSKVGLKKDFVKSVHP